MKTNKSTRPPRALFKQMALLGAKGSPPRVAVAIRTNAQFRQAEKHLSRTDKVLGRLIKKISPCRLKAEKTVSPFAALVEAVAYQQLNGTAAAAILGRVKGLFPGHRFPTPEDFLRTTAERLRAAGLSRAKIAAIKDISEKAMAGVVPTSRAIVKMSDEEIVECLTTLRGVGRWTAEMLLIFKLGRPDVWPVTDYGVRQGFARMFGRGKLPTPAELQAYGERWRPYRTVATWYLWRSMALK